MSFFDAVEPDDEGGRPRPTVYREPPRDVIPGIVCGAQQLATSTVGAVYLGPVEAYTEGWHVALVAVWREESRTDEPFAWASARDERAIRFGVAFSDGRRVATPLDGMPCAIGERDASGERPLAIWGHGGRGAAGRWEHRYWIEPLPPAGPVELYVQWRAAGIETTGKRLDGELFAAAARAARPLWSGSA